MSESTARPSSPWTALLPAALLCAALAAAGWWSAEALVVTQTVREARTVADMAENVGRWASQYGGVHARTVGAAAAIPGNFLTRSVFATTAGDADVLAGTQAADSGLERAAMARVETFYWKNPALIQREVADVIAESGSKSRYRLTARTVLNKNNAPNAFEVEALDALQQGPATPEHWVVRNGQVLYARAVIAQKSCLRCHDTPQAAPEFIRTNAMFNGGGGYGYAEGKPVGLVSVTVPLQTTRQALADGVPARVWGALAAAAAGLIWLVALLGRRQRA